jgi:hypothetical protein
MHAAVASNTTAATSQLLAQSRRVESVRYVDALLAQLSRLGASRHRWNKRSARCFNTLSIELRKRASEIALDEKGRNITLVG